MEGLYHQTNKMVYEIQIGLGRLERASQADVHTVENELQARIDQMISNCERLEILVNKEPPTKRANSKLRVDQLKYDLQHLQAAMRNMLHRRYKREEEERERDILMATNFSPNDTETSVMIDHALQHSNRLNNSHKEIDNLLHSGGSVLSNLREQRVTLKGAKKKMLDIANVLGLSNTVLRLIERRTAQDKVILYGGMILTLTIMFFVWHYFG